MLALRAQIQHRRLARWRQVAHRLVTFVRSPGRGGVAGAQLLRKAHGVEPIGLHAISRALRNQRRRRHHAVVAKARDLPVRPVSGWAGLVAERQTLILRGKLAHQLRHRRRRVLDLTIEADLTTSSTVRNRYRMTQLRRIQTDVRFAMILHDSPSLREALPGPSG